MKLSLVTVTYNNLAGLKRTYNSLTAFLEKHQDAEWIVIDGGSSDGTCDFLDNHALEIAYYVSEKDNGIYNAMNKGVKHATGEYLWFLNGGDCATPQMLKLKSLDFLTGEDIIYGDVLLDDGLGNLSTCVYSDKLSVDYFIGNYLCHQALFFKKKLNDNLMYDESYKIAADLALLIKWLFVENRTSKHLKIPVCVYNTQGVSASKYYSVTRLEIRKAVSQCLVGGEYWYDAILMFKEWGNAKGGESLKYIARTQMLKRVVGEIIDKMVAIHKQWISFRQL